MRVAGLDKRGLIRPEDSDGDVNVLDGGGGDDDDDVAGPPASEAAAPTPLVEGP